MTTQEPPQKIDLEQKIEDLKNAESEQQESETQPEESLSESLQNENEILKDKLMRSVADVQNIKRRSEKERVKARFDGAVSTLHPVISLLDNFDRAFNHIPDDIQGHEFIASLQSLQSSFLKNLEEAGVSFFGTTGDIFDSNLHESMMMDPSAENNTIAQVFERGVKYKEQVVRHAKVSVGSNND